MALNRVGPGRGCDPVDDAQHWVDPASPSGTLDEAIVRVHHRGNLSGSVLLFVGEADDAEER
jgi:hypothetical protein